ncbi:MAG: hypothetical protein FWD31_13630, partial [Planctomycetaceae bacterium]|nr:hypothetical protein [Planctomycetaceae bacterium]
MWWRELVLPSVNAVFWLRLAAARLFVLFGTQYQTSCDSVLKHKSHSVSAVTACLSADRRDRPAGSSMQKFHACRFAL